MYSVPGPVVSGPGLTVAVVRLQLQTLCNDRQIMHEEISKVFIIYSLYKYFISFGTVDINTLCKFILGSFCRAKM